MSEIKIVKLISGEEIIASRDLNTYSKPRVFQITQQGAGLVPWIMLAPDADVQINSSAIAAEIPAPLEVEKQYLKATSSLQLLS